MVLEKSMHTCIHEANLKLTLNFNGLEQLSTSTIGRVDSNVIAGNISLRYRPT